MVVKEHWDNSKNNGIFWLGGNVSILAHEAGFVKLEKTKEYYGEDLEKSKPDFRCSRRRSKRY